MATALELTGTEVSAYSFSPMMFRQERETVAAAIRRRRLERGRADLADPRLRRRTIAETAARWGYRHPADFSRAFRRAHGISPSDYRHLAQSTD
ncbi:helix-turn-helix domain-containing protein [Streptomyces bobili]|uniref:helix-turn-helix domain-containing protein n=1 Tax=Streptomyces bobili TaxID=67280 RepID=UPI003818D1CE